MKRQQADDLRLDHRLAATLQYGTWLASFVIALGLVATWTPWPPSILAAAQLVGARLVVAGVALFILLPVLRVLLMLAAFIRARDHRLGAVAALVMILILLGFVVGLAEVAR